MCWRSEAIDRLSLKPSEELKTEDVDLAVNTIRKNTPHVFSPEDRPPSPPHRNP